MKDTCGHRNTHAHAEIQISHKHKIRTYNISQRSKIY